MDKLKSDQREKVKQYMGFTSTKEAFAIKQLAKFKWNTERAIQDFFDNPPYIDETEIVSSGRLEQLYEKYKDAADGKIGPDGLDRFCSDIGIKSDDIVVLVISWKLNAKELYVLEKNEFVEGFKALGCDDIAAIKKMVPAFRKALTTPDQFKLLYKFVFQMSKGATAKTLDIDAATALWDQLLGNEKFPLLKDWCDFLQYKGSKVVSRDEWNMTFDFAQKYKSRASLRGYSDDTDMWPTTMDDFVDFMKEKHKQVFA
eukprot:TRINITY_DN13881_c0_g1_i1.p1 TRINITY_DN13881_c0_g1~~TRINITY_DN13881_c0_g1_i1.p1  ORF type:complete len:274 (-),score=62.61 TRINITY_DN13881_c0_g1_i1:127-897(-)